MGVAVAFYTIVLIRLFSILQDFVMLLIASWPRDTPGRRAEASAHRPVSVLVPCFNERKVLRRTLDSILLSEGVDIVQVICIDDGSTDGTIEVMLDSKRRYGDKVTVLRQVNMGKAVALNHGLTAVETSLFVSIDADTQVMPDALVNLLEHFEDEEVAAVSGQMLVGNQKPYSRAVYAAQAREYEFANNIDRSAFSKMHRITVVPGAIGAFRTDAVTAVGGYPHDTLSEDAHLTFKLLMRRHKVVHEPSAVVLTEAPDTISGLFKQRVRWATGKTQVTLRTCPEALRQHGKTSLLWAHMAVNQAVLPLLKVFTPVGAIVIPAYLALVSSRDARSPGATFLPSMIVIAMLVMLLQLAYSWIAMRFARALDVEPRARARLALTRLSPVSLAIMPVVTCAASWVAWFVIITGRRKTWDKLDRRGDVSLLPG